MTDTATEPGPCAALLAAGDREFLGFLAAWEHDKEPPPPLADWLRDRGHDRAADAVEWLCRRARHPKLFLWVMPRKFPDGRFAWFCLMPRDTGVVAGDEFPGLGSSWTFYPSFADAIATALDCGVEEKYR